MEPEQASKVFEPDSAQGLGVALRNVADRLRGFYGPESRLKIESAPDEGTKVSFQVYR
jgi:two-component system sensor histidine kinase LytS